MYMMQRELQASEPSTGMVWAMYATIGCKHGQCHVSAAERTIADGQGDTTL
jgi:hypothetical protein